MREWAGLLIALILLSPASPWAQEAQEAGETQELPIHDIPPVQVEAPKGIEAIEVTGERMSGTDVQDTAQAVTAFGMAELDKLHIVNVDGLATNVPSLHVGQQGQAAIITLRGVGTENASLTGEAGVAFHVDDINYARPSAARAAFYDLEFLEVKRGPQGLMGGKNSTSGAIYVNTKDPTGDFETQGDVLFGNYDRVRIRGTVNVPMGEFVAGRFAIFSEQRDGYLDRIPASSSNDPFDVDNLGLRGKLRFTPSDSVNLVVGYNYFKEGGVGPQADPVPRATPWTPCADPNKNFLPPISTVGASYQTRMGQFVACQTTTIPARQVTIPGVGTVTIPKAVLFTPGKEDLDPRKIYSNTGSEQNDKYWGYASKLDWDVPELPFLGETELKLIGGIQHTKTSFLTDFDGSSVDLFNLQTGDQSREYSSQAFWSGEAFQEKLEWQTSLFWMKETGDGIVFTPTFGSGDTTSVSTSGAQAQTVKSDQGVENSSYGLALHGSYHLTDSLTFSVGERWIKDHKESFLHRRIETPGRPETNTEACIGGNFSPVRDPSDPTGNSTIFLLPTCKVTYRGQMWGTRLEWRPTDDHLLYAGFDKGYKSGGFALGGVGGYLPEEDWAYTLGSKSEFFDQRLVVNLEGFWYDYKDMQLALIDGTEVRTENSDARMYGAELEISASPIEGLQLRALGNIIHTETIDYFSLDPAANDDPYQETRLAQRSESERIGKVFPSDNPPGNCHPPGRPRDAALCSSLGDKNGLDDYSGNELSRSPKYKYMLSADYEIPLGRLGSLTPGWKYSWSDDTYYRVFNRDFDLQKAYHTTDLKLAWNSPERRWNAEVFVDNVENNAIKDYISIGSRLFGAPPLAWYGAPRFYGFSVGFKY